MGNWKRDEDDDRNGKIQSTGSSRFESGYYYIEYEDGKQEGLAFDKYDDARDFLDHK